MTEKNNFDDLDFRFTVETPNEIVATTRTVEMLGHVLAQAWEMGYFTCEADGGKRTSLNPFEVHINPLHKDRGCETD